MYQKAYEEPVLGYDISEGNKRRMICADCFRAAPRRYEVRRSLMAKDWMWKPCCHVCKKMVEDIFEDDYRSC